MGSKKKTNNVTTTSSVATSTTHAQDAFQTMSYEVLFDEVRSLQNEWSLQSYQLIVMEKTYLEILAKLTFTLLGPTTAATSMDRYCCNN